MCWVDAVTIGTLAAQMGYGLTYTGANYNITAKALSATASAVNKVYDGNTTAAATLAIDPAGFAGAETVSATGAGTFNNKNVLNATLVTLSSTTLADGANGGLASNYSLAAGQTAAASITQRALTVNATGQNRVYDGGTAAGVTLTDNRVTGDSLTASSAAASFFDKNAGTGKAINVSGISVSGADAANYSANSTASTTADITRAPIASVTGITANDKMFDGTTSAMLNTSGADYAGIIGGDVLTVATASGNFDTPAAGSGKTVAIAGLTLGGTEAGNYTLVNNTAATTASIIDRSKLGGVFVSSLLPAPPQAFVLADLTAAFANALLESVPTASGSSETKFTMLREPTGQQPGSASVTVTISLDGSGSGFRFSLPADFLGGDGPLQATLSTGAPLPDWLRFDPNTRWFVASGTPADALPMQILISAGGRSVVLTIVEARREGPPRGVLVDQRAPVPAGSPG